MGSALHAAGVHVIQVISPSVSNGEALAKLLDAKHETSIERIVSADLYCIALPDRLIEPVVSKISFPLEATVVHSSGSIPLSVLSSRIPNCGVLYPFQTFTRGRVVPLKNVPVFIEGTNDKTVASIKDLAETISTVVTPICSEQRRSLHLAGVIANNFTNFLLGLSSEWMIQNGFSLHLLQPLMTKP